MQPQCLFLRIAFGFQNMTAKMGGPFSSLLGGAVGDQSELELRMITQLCGESSDSCSGIDALVESGPEFSRGPQVVR